MTSCSPLFAVELWLCSLSLQLRIRSFDKQNRFLWSMGGLDTAPMLSRGRTGIISRCVLNLLFFWYSLWCSWLNSDLNKLFQSARKLQEWIYCISGIRILGTSVKSITEILLRIVRLDRTGGGNDCQRIRNDKQMLGKIDKGLGVRFYRSITGMSWGKLTRDSRELNWTGFQYREMGDQITKPVKR